MKKVKLSTEKRKLFGRKVKKLRQEDFLPANIYGKNIKSVAVQTKLSDFLEVFKQVGETGIVEISLKGEEKSRSVLVANLQKHSVTEQLLHVDFHQVSLTEKVQVAIPIELIGESPAVNKGGVLVQMLNEVEVEALPTDLPEKFEVSVVGLKEIDQSITIRDLKVDKTKIKILIDDEDRLMVKIEEPAKEEVEEKPTEEAKPEEGEEEAKEAKPEEGKKEAKEAEKPIAGKTGKPEEKTPSEKKKE